MDGLEPWQGGLLIASQAIRRSGFVRDGEAENIDPDPGKTCRYRPGRFQWPDCRALHCAGSCRYLAASGSKRGDRYDNSQIAKPGYLFSVGFICLALLDGDRGAHDDFAMGKRDVDAIFLERVPQREQHGAADIGQSVVAGRRSRSACRKV